MERMILFVILLSLAACNLDPAQEQNNLENETPVYTGQVNLAINKPQSPLATWHTGNFAIYSTDVDNKSFRGRFSYLENNIRINYFGDFSFSEEEDFDYIFKNKARFETTNDINLSLKIKLLQKGSSCVASPDSEYCATVMLPDKYEISDVQSFE